MPQQPSAVCLAVYELFWGALAPSCVALIGRAQAHWPWERDTNQEVFSASRQTLLYSTLLHNAQAMHLLAACMSVGAFPGAHWPWIVLSWSAASGRIGLQSALPIRGSVPLPRRQRVSAAPAGQSHAPFFKLFKLFSVGSIFEQWVVRCHRAHFCHPGRHFATPPGARVPRDDWTTN